MRSIDINHYKANIIQNLKEWRKGKIDMVNELKICGSVYKIARQDTIIESGNEVRFGDISHGNLTIRIATQYPYPRQLQTLMHEAVHAMNTEYHLELKDDADADLFSNAIYALIIDNKQFIKDILENG